MDLNLGLIFHTAEQKALSLSQQSANGINKSPAHLCDGAHSNGCFELFRSFLKLCSFNCVTAVSVGPKFDDYTTLSGCNILSVS